METVFIYAHNCPITGRARYIGKSKAPRRRLKDHLLRARENTSHQANWIRSLSARGLRPVLEILDEVPETEWQFWEREWIRLYKSLGFDLTNSTDGGEGVDSGEKHPNFGKPMPEKQRGMRRRNRRVNNLSGVPGVSWDKENGRWRASIGIDGKYYNLGRFQTLEEAVAARERALTVVPILSTV